MSVPHALDEHSPVLVGPIPFITPGSDPFSSTAVTNTSGGGGEGVGSIIDLTINSTSCSVESMLWMSVGNRCSAVLIATTDGTVGAHILTGTAVPTWQESTPQCLLSGTDDGVVAVRSQVSSSGGPYLSLQQLLLLDVIQLDCPDNSSKSYSAQELQDDDDGDDYGGNYNDTSSSSSSIFLTQDLEAEEVAYCIHVTGGVYAITLPWLPLLSNALLTAAMNSSSSSSYAGVLSHSPSSSSIVLPSVLPPATVTTLFSSTSVATVNGGIIDCIAVGDKLAGSGLLLLLGDGSYRCLSRNGGGVGGGGRGEGGEGEGRLLLSQAADEEQQEEREIQAQVKAIYSDLLHLPGKAPLPSATSSDVATPEGQRQLSQCIKALQSTHAEYALKVHHDLLERLPLIKQEVEKQKSQITAMKQLAQKVTMGSQSLQKRATRAEQMQINLEERLRLLAELYVAIPRPVSVAEKRFAEGELPELEGAVRDMVGELKMIRGRAAHIKATGSGGGTGSSGAIINSNSMYVPPAQMKRLKEALDQHGQGILMALDRLSMLESALDAQEAQVYQLK
jgi:hypothetical protein